MNLGDAANASDRPILAPSGSIVMLSNGGASTNAMYHAISARFSVTAVIVEKKIPRSRLLRRRAARIGWARALDQVAFSVLLSPLLRFTARHRLHELKDRLDATTPIPADRLLHVSSVNDRACLDELSRLQPRVVVVSGTRIIQGELIRSVDARFLNVHSGITPRYRGSHGAYWAYAEGRPAAAGVTVHVVDAGIDTGQIIGQAIIVPTPADNVITYPYLQLEAGIPILLDAIDAALHGRLTPTASLDDSTSKLWFHPGALAYVGRRMSRGVR